MNFALERQKAKLVNLNARAEKHGDQHVPAADLDFSFDAPNDVLSEFDPALKSSLYRRADSNGDQQDLLDTPGYLPNLRFPAMSAFKWEAKMVGGQLTVHYGTSERSDIVMDVAKADSFKFEPKDGGTVLVSFRAAVHPSEKQFGKLCSLIQEDVEISLAPPSAGQPAADQGAPAEAAA